MKIINKKIDDLKPYKLNAKLHPEKQIDGIAESIRRFGFTQPIVIDKNNEIIIGHGRHAAATKAGLKEVPCVMMDGLNENEVKALRLIDNRISETGWDNEMLNMDLQSIDADFSSFNIDFDFLAESVLKEGATELKEEDFSEFEHQCPKCGFEFGEKE